MGVTVCVVCVNNCCRIMSYAHVWSRSVWLLACPVVLSYDWQMGSIPLVTQLNDHRNVLSAALLLSVCALLFCVVVRSITNPVCSAPAAAGTHCLADRNAAD